MLQEASVLTLCHLPLPLIPESLSLISLTSVMEAPYLCYSSWGWESTLGYSLHLGEALFTCRLLGPAAPCLPRVCGVKGRLRCYQSIW